MQSSLSLDRCAQLYMHFYCCTLKSRCTKWIHYFWKNRKSSYTLWRFSINNKQVFLFIVKHTNRVFSLLSTSFVVWSIKNMLLIWIFIKFGIIWQYFALLSHLICSDSKYILDYVILVIYFNLTLTMLYYIMCYNAESKTWFKCKYHI